MGGLEFLDVGKGRGLYRAEVLIEVKSVVDLLHLEWVDVIKIL